MGKKAIRLWKGYHSADLLDLIQRTWIENSLLILCPPLLADLSFLPILQRSFPSRAVEFYGEWGTLEPAVPFKQVEWPTGFEKPVLGVFTSGTVSGKPRLVLYSKQNITTSLSDILELFDLGKIDQIFCYPQPFHTFGLLLGYLLSLLYDFPLVTGQGRYSSSFHQLWVDSHSPGLLTLGTPTQLQDLVSFTQQRKIRVPNSYSCIAGGSIVSVDLWNNLQEKLRIRAPSIGYGATEASPGISHLPPGVAPVEDGEIGRPLKRISVQLLPGAGIRISGASLCTAFIQDGELKYPKSLLIKDDIGFSKNGNLIIHGRHDLVLNRGGLKFSLEQIEAQLRAEFGGEFVCVSVKHPRLGEELGIAAKLKFRGSTLPVQPTRRAIYAFLEEKFGTRFFPDYLNFVDEIPLNSSMKIDRCAIASGFRDAAP